MKGLVFVLLWVVLMGCMGMSEQPEFEVVVAKEGDEVETAVTANSVLFDITSQSGIGSAAVKLVQGQMPETVLFRLYLVGLEEFKFVYGDTEVKVSVSSSGENIVLETVSQNGETQPITKDSPYYMPVRIESENGETGIPLEDGYFELEAPVDFNDSDYDSFAISWVDFYR